METLLLILGGIVMVGIGYGFYKFIQHRKENRETDNQFVKDEAKKIVDNVKNTIEDLKNKL